MPYEAKEKDGKYYIIRKMDDNTCHCIEVPPEKEDRLMCIFSNEDKLQTLYLFLLAKKNKEQIWGETIQPIVKEKTKTRKQKYFLS